MTFEDLRATTGRWLESHGPDSDIVLSSRVRLARNLSDRVFVQWADDAERESVASALLPVLRSSSYFTDCFEADVNSLSELERRFLVERHLVSPEFIEGGAGRYVVVSQGEVVAAMVNEEDHLRVQSLVGGFQPLEAWRILERLDEELSSKISFAFSSKLGYLTACPTNVGTGMRVSVMMHLPALVMTKEIGKVMQALGKLGLAVRGLFGEGSNPSGNFFQISNQVTLGLDEVSIVENIERIAREIMQHERQTRELLFTRKRLEVEDRVYRAYGLLRNARLLSSEEALSLLSSLRLGVDLGLVRGVDRATLNEIFVGIQPAHLQLASGGELPAVDRDVRRADYVRKALAGAQPGN